MGNTLYLATITCLVLVISYCSCYQFVPPPSPPLPPPFPTLSSCIVSQIYNTQPSRLVCQKYVRGRKGAVKMCMTVLKMRITCKQKCDRNVCELWIAECAFFRFQSWNYYFSVQVAYHTQIDYKNARSNALSPWKCVGRVLKRLNRV